MKPLHFLPPAAALAIAGGWLGIGRVSITTLEKETVLLRQHIAAARHAAAPDERSSAAARGKQAEEPEAIDWKDLAETLAKAERGGMPDMRAMMKLQTKLMALEGPELVAALDEIAALELSNEARRSLESTLINLLAQKDPQLALDRYFDKLSDQHSTGNWQLAHAFQQWVGKDSAAALAWFDTQVAAGKFESKSLDGKSQSRLQFEAAVVASLINTDPDAAGKRIAALPEDQRRDLFQQGMLLNVKPGSEKAHAALIREHVPENERGQAFSSMTAMMMVEGGYEKVGGFLEEIEATPGERKEVAKQAATNKLQQLSHQGKIDRAAVDEMRTWITAQAPDDVDTITGESLGNLWNPQVKWEENAKLIEELHAENPSDDLLVSFLEGHRAMQNREAARTLAEKISDETKRAELISRFEGQPVRRTIIAE